MKRWLTASLCLPLLAASPSDSGESPVRVGGGGSVTLGELLQIAQDTLGIEYFVADPADLSTQLHFFGAPLVEVGGFLAFFERALRSHGFLHFVEGEGPDAMHEIVPLRADAGRVNTFKARAMVVSPEEALAMADRCATLITTHYTTRWLPARDAVNTLQAYFADNFTEQIRGIEGTRTLLMTGRADNVAGFVRLLRVIDVEPAEMTRDERATRERIAALEQLVQALQARVDLLDGQGPSGVKAGGK